MTAWMLALLLAPQTGDNAPPEPERIDQAIRRGTAALFALAETDAGHDMFRCDELLLYALAHAGQGNDPRTRKLVDKVLKKDLDEGGYPTYLVSIRAMALAQLHPRRYQTRIAQCAWWLVNTQTDNGQWDYWGLGEKPPAGFPRGAWPGKVATGEASKDETALIVKRTAKWADRPPHRNFGVILRNTSTAQYAILGLYAAHRAKVWIPPETWERTLKAALTGQNKQGAWGYVHPEDKGNGWKIKGYNAPMTASQLSVMAVLQDVLETPPPELRQAVDRGFAYLAEKMSLGPGAVRGPKTQEGYDTTGVYYHYWLYSVERAGILWDREKIGDHWWYNQGANQLLRAQNADGSWGEDFKGATDRPANTAFAILFLKRAVPPPVITGK